MRRALPHRCSASLHAPVLHSSIGLSRGASRPCAARSRGEAKRSRGMFAPPLRAAEPAPLGAVRALLTRCVTAADAMLSAPRSQRGPSRSIGASILRARDTAAHIGNGSARRTLLWLQALCLPGRPSAQDRGRGIVPVAFCMRSRIPISSRLARRDPVVRADSPVLLLFGEKKMPLPSLLSS